jgi:hypothetical protein
MESLHRVSSVWFGLGVAALGLLAAGCAQPSATALRPGELEMRVESGSYAVIGRFHLAGVGPGMPVHELDFDASTSSVRVPLAPGAYVLTLHPGARLDCREGGGVPGAETAASERRVSAWPQRIAISPGELTKARIGFGSAPTLSPRGVAHLGRELTALDPCANPAVDTGLVQAMMTR